MDQEISRLIKVISDLQDVMHNVCDAVKDLQGRVKKLEKDKK